MDLEIIELRKRKFTIEQIAAKLGITVGQVKYRIYKKNLDTKSTKESLQVSRSNSIPLPPNYYGENEIVLIVQGPTSLYVYWEITWPLSHMVGDFFNVSFESLPRILRIYDVTDIWFNGRNAHWSHDIPINHQADNWFISDLAPDRTYTIELGVGWQNRFLPLLRSKPKSTPRNQPVPDGIAMHSGSSQQSLERIKPQWFENFSTYTLY
ncbi:MAG TPA: DUF4912 domain-containing protein [Bacillota bacterium]|nr:DUF4912 domain-containing protein [Bacillota bacterium]